MIMHLYTVLQGGLVLWYPLSPVAAFAFEAIVCSSYLAGGIAWVSVECLAPSFGKHLARQTATTVINELITSNLVKHLV